jgi:hypothetical protein
MLFLSILKPNEVKGDDSMKNFYEKWQQVFHQFLNKRMHILLKEFDTEMGSEDVFKLRFGNKSLHTSKECKPDSNKLCHTEECDC